jgi:UDP-glucose 4-epimerase
MRVLITGGAGYIGSHLVEHLSDLGVECHVIDNLSRGLIERISPRAEFEKLDLCDSNLLNKYMRDHSFNAIFHLAGLMQARESERNPEIYLQNNVQATRNLINSISSPEKTQVIFSSSCSVYGNYNLAEVGSPLEPLSVYAKTKVQSESELRTFFTRSYHQLSIFRFFNVIGCSEIPFFSDIQKETILPASARRILRGQKPLILGGNFKTIDGFAIRDFIDVRDIVRALCLPIVKGLSGIHNLSSNNPTSVRSIVELLLEISKTQNKGFEIAEPNTADPSVITSSTSTKVRDLGWEPQFSQRGSVENFWSTFEAYWLECENTNS